MSQQTQNEKQTQKKTIEEKEKEEETEIEKDLKTAKWIEILVTSCNYIISEGIWRQPGCYIEGYLIDYKMDDYVLISINDDERYEEVYVVKFKYITEMCIDDRVTYYFENEDVPVDSSDEELEYDDSGL